MSEKTIRLAVVSGGLSEESATNRLGDALVTAFRQAAASHAWDVEVSSVSIRDLAQEIAAGSLSGFVGSGLNAAYEAVGHADAIMALTPTYKASYTGLFKGFWDVSPDGFIADVPVMLGATGGSERHSLMIDTAMRPLFGYMGARSMPTGIYAATSDWGSSGLSRRIERAATELFETAAMRQGGLGALATGASGGGETSSTSGGNHELKDRRERANDPFVNVPTMAQMLGQMG